MEIVYELTGDDLLDDRAPDLEATRPVPETKPVAVQQDPVEKSAAALIKDLRSSVKGGRREPAEAKLIKIMRVTDRLLREERERNG